MNTIKTKTTRSKLALLVIIVGLVVSGCAPEEVTIKETASKFLELLLARNYEKVSEMVVTKNSVTNFPDDIRHKVDVTSQYISLYHGSEIKGLIPDHIDSTDFRGRKIIKIPLFQGIDSSNGLKKATLFLFFGPKFIADYQHVQDFQLEQEFDMKIRRKMFPPPIIRSRER